MPKKPRMTDDQYIAAGGTKCPYCGSEDIDGQHVDVDAGTATQELTCTECGGEWMDTYCLVGYVPQRIPK